MLRSKKKSPAPSAAKTITEVEAMMESVRAQMATLEAMIAKEKKETSGDEVENGQQDGASEDEVEKELSSDDVKQILFEGSTHRFLFLDTIKEDGKEYKVGCWNKCLAILVLVVQFYSYLFLGKTISQVEPETDPDASQESFLYIPSFFLLFCFLSQDTFEVLVLLRCKGCMAKLTALFILLEAGLAIFVAWTGAIMGLTGSFDFLDGFLLVVGVVFIHDIDEQFGYWKNVKRRLGNKFNCVEVLFWVLFVVATGVTYIFFNLLK